MTSFMDDPIAATDSSLGYLDISKKFWVHYLILITKPMSQFALIGPFYVQKVVCASEAQNTIFHKNSHDCREIQKFNAPFIFSKNWQKCFCCIFFDNKKLKNNTFHRKFNCFPATRISVETLFLCVWVWVGLFTTGVNFINVFICSFYTRRSQKCKKLLKFAVFSRFWDLRV